MWVSVHTKHKEVDFEGAFTFLGFLCLGALRICLHCDILEFMTISASTTNSNSTTNFAKMMGKPTCLIKNCDNPSRSRGLCGTCYQMVYRAGELGLYPTNDMINDPDNVIRAAFNHFPDHVAEIAFEFGYKLEPLGIGIKLD